MMVRVKQTVSGLLKRFVRRVGSADEKTSAFTVVERSYYREWQISLPMNSAKEAKKVLALSADEYDGSLLRKSSGGGYKVTCWRYKMPFNTNGFVFPESVVLASPLEVNHYAEVVTPNNTLFIANNDGAIHSAQKTQLMPSAHQFALSIGLNPSHQQVVSQADYAQGILALFTEWHRFRVDSTSPGWPLWRWVAPVAVVALAYFSATSVYLNQRVQSLQSQYNQSSNELDEALQLQSQLEQQKQKLTAMHELEQRTKSSFAIWKVLMPLYQQKELSIRRISKTEDGFELFGYAPRATDVLRTITQMPGVQGAFNRPVSSRRGEETFSIALTIDYPALADWMPEQRDSKQAGGDQ